MNFFWLFFFVVTFNFWVHLFQFFYWKMVDLSRSFGKRRKIHIYGIWLFCGLYGGGKTMALTHYLVAMRKKYGDKIYISTNYGFSGEDFPLMNWKDLLKAYDRPVIFGYDEIQNEFNSREYRSFPPDLVRLLTQNRKGHGKQIVGTAQRFGRVDKVIRELCTHVVECKTFAGRWTITRRYDIDDYEMWRSQVNVSRRQKIPCIKESFIQTDELRQSYDSFQMLESARVKYCADEEKEEKTLSGGADEEETPSGGVDEEEALSESGQADE